MLAEYLLRVLSNKLFPLLITLLHEHPLKLKKISACEVVVSDPWFPEYQ